MQLNMSKLEIYNIFLLILKKKYCLCGKKWVRSRAWRVLGPPIKGGRYSE